MSWGNKLLLVFIAFGGLMFFMVYNSMNTHFDLVTKEYYKEELAYQGIIDGRDNARKLNGKLSLTEQDSHLVLQLPEEVTPDSVSGKIWFYCVTDASKDLFVDLQPGDDGIQRIPINALKADKYTVKVEWNQGGTKYYSEERFKKQP